MTGIHQPARESTTSDRIQDTLYGFARSQLIFSALELNLFTAIEQGYQTVELLSGHLSLEPRALRIFMDGLVGIGFLLKEDAAYALPPDVEKYLVQTSPDYMGGMVSHCQRLYDSWIQLSDTVRSGQPAGGAQILADMEAYFSELVKGLYVSNYPTAQLLAQRLGLGRNLSGLNILDVAGGSGVWSIAMLEADPTSRATLLDYPSVTQVAQQYLQSHGLRDRYSMLPGDLEEMNFPESEFDLAVLGNICHAMGPAATQKLFYNVAKALKPQGYIVVIDFVPDDERAKPGWPLLFGVNMLICTPDGNVFTHSEYRQWLQHAGFHPSSVMPLESDVTVITAQKA